MLKRFATEEAQAIIDSSHDGIIVIDKETRVCLANQHATRLLGLPAHIVGSKLTEFIPNTDLLRILQTGKTEFGDIATELNHKLIINRLPILENGEVIGVVSNFKEIHNIQKMEMKIRKQLHQSGLEARHQLSNIVGSSDRLEECRILANKFAKTEATVMILGESGTGKEWFSQGIHLSSSRAAGPFVAINCAALPESLLESELFGYEEGTFTGAAKGGKMGLFELAHGGTIFLDEIGEMPLQIQAMLLRTIEEREIRRVGGQKVVPVDVRIIVATNRDLETMVEEGAFRKDLYYRLNVLTLELPLLCERLSDIPELVDSFLREFNEKSSKKIDAISQDVLTLFQQYHWPGNVRELKNVVERMVLLTEEGTLTMKDAHFFKKKVDKSAVRNPALPDLEKQAIISALKEEKGNKTKAAERLGFDRSTLWRKIKKYNIS
ncbi:PAS domain S-box-containing protein [Scopulibacillus darangshiensis]|uniref:PAS domain S-box-containing protein n=1 Tax=Scopulibacillus darangshiensis TaxID=442528 RepID=A0A4R2P4T2_9BACL|nr:sigma 54-interacting transcriptional regulator [Scopulibacillus darangshiensis]TCP28775.1 PAS domain S-box-containing protein [Scopulibacillus darangshiensis]